MTHLNTTQSSSTGGVLNSLISRLVLLGAMVCLITGFSALVADANPPTPTPTPVCVQPSNYTIHVTALNGTIWSDAPIDPIVKPGVVYAFQGSHDGPEGFGNCDPGFWTWSGGV